MDAVLGVERSVSGRRWRSRLADARAGLALAQRLGAPEIVGRVLAARGVAAESAESFLNPTLKAMLPDPSRLADMDTAVGRLVRAVKHGETVVVYGDYDVDGATAAALLKRYLDAVGAAARIYVPDRLREGYGPNAPALLRLKAEGAAVVVTVDCGVTAFEPLAAAAKAGLDVIVVDHHIAEPRLPEAVAVVDANRIDDTSGCGELAAVGVAYLLVVGLNRALRAEGWFASRPEPDLRRALDLVALGTVCDMVPLTGVNRALVRQGFKVMAHRTNLGLATLADVAGVDQRPGTYHAAFVLGPRINAGGRVGEASLGARLLATDDVEEARALACRLDELNTERRRIEAVVEAAAARQIEDSEGEPGPPGPPSPVVFAVGEGWHPGVIGIVAGRLSRRLFRPAFVVALAAGVGKGSGRSIPGVDIGAAVIAARQAGLLIDGGGHPAAAGLTVAADRVAELREFLTARLGPAVAVHGVGPSLGIDGAIAPRAATPELVELLDRVGPFGVGNAEPRFAVAGSRVVRADVVGERHVRCILADDHGGRLNAIAFRSLETPVGPALLNAAGRALHVAGHLRADSWRGRERVQMFIEDVAPAGL
ncbi:MAG: single-stranded-DNA-specific exonuclease RecJ [Proteobacteria bacterium]|nr:single-stranded-DNA-specific exonuclease RecJ [Pseudomonadota bacterium]